MYTSRYDILLSISSTLEMNDCSIQCMNNVHIEMLSLDILYIHLDMSIVNSLYI